MQDQIYSTLKKKILSGGLQPDVIYSETKTAAELGVSKTPVKAAILRLSQENYVQIIPSKGFCLREITVEDIWEIYRIRTAIEGYCAVLLIQQKDTLEGKNTIQQLTACVEDLCRLTQEQKKAPQNEDIVTALLENNIIFHQTIVNFAKSKKFLELFRSHCQSILKSTSENYLSFPRMEQICREHQQIIQLIQGGDKEACYRAVEEHMRITRDNSLKIHPER